MFTTATVTTTSPAPVFDPEEDAYHPDHIWCITSANPCKSLCGHALPGERGMPPDEVPDEQTCADCLRIERAMKRIAERWEK